MLKISVVTVSFNSCNTIGSTLESLRNQTDQNFESIVVDGNSNDGTQDIIESYKDVVTKSISEPDDGIYDAMNKGIAMASGEFVSFLNSDDAYLPNTISTVRKHAELGSIIYGNMKKERWFNDNRYTRIEIPKLEAMPKTMGIFHPSVFVKRELFAKYGQFNTNYKLASDYHWLLGAYLEKETFTYVDEVLSVFRIGGVSNVSCQSYKEAASIQKDYNLPYQAMLDLYQKCAKKSKKAKLLSKLIQYPIFQTIYENRLKKRWS